MKRSSHIHACLSILVIIGCSKATESLTPKGTEKGTTPVSSNVNRQESAPVASNAVSSPAETNASAPKTSHEAPEGLVRLEVKFDFDGCKYALPAPSNSKIKTMFGVTVFGGPHFNLKIDFGRYDLPGMSANMKQAEIYEFVSETSDTLIFKKKTLQAIATNRPANSFVFFMNRTFGYRDFTITSEEYDPQSMELVYSQEDCQTMIRAAREFALAEPLPEDAGETLTLFNATVHRSDDGTVEHVMLSNTSTTDATMPLLEKLPTIKSLYYTGNGTSEAGLAVITRLPVLERLTLGDPNSRVSIGDKLISLLSGLPHLTHLSIGTETLTPDGLSQLGELKSLESLTIATPIMTDSTLAEFPLLPNLVDLQIYGKTYGDDALNGSGLGILSKLPKLQSLDLTKQQITDSGLEEVARLTSLTTLNLSGCDAISAAGIAQLVVLKKLTTLTVSGPKIDDQAVESLMQIKSLKQLSVFGTRITDEGKKKLKSALTDCEIY